MPGMHSGVNVTNSVMVAAFRSALMHQGLVALLVLASLAIIWAGLREWRPALIRTLAATSAGRGAVTRAAVSTEPPARRLIRIGFGLLWVFDGVLQAQPAMAAGLPSQVVAPAAATSPGWVRHLVNWAGTSWSYHPIQASTAAIWLQVGIGLWMLASPRGPWSRLAGAAGAAWGLVVWVFGEAFGGIFAPGLTVLFGAPGAAAFYALAGVLIALPGRSWHSAALGRRLLGGLGLFLIAMAVLQAWPGRGFWQGRSQHGPGSLTAMINEMSGTPQPALFHHLAAGFGSFTASHGFLINAVCVATLALLGAGLLARRSEILLPVLIACAVFCLADWVLIEDIGFFGGMGTDPNSMLPLLALLGCGYLALTRPGTGPAGEPQPADRSGWLDKIRPVRLAAIGASASATGVLAVWAVGITLLGAAPMAVAQVNQNADPIIARALGGPGAHPGVPAASFNLISQYGKPVSLASLRGKVVLLTFLDPVCTAGCPPVAQELRAADLMLGASASRVEIVAIAANPLYYARPYLAAFGRQEQLTGLRNWLYLTGPLAALRKAWAGYGITAQALPGSQVTGRNDLVFVISHGTIVTRFGSDPGAGTASSESSFAVEFARAAEQALSP